MTAQDSRQILVAYLWGLSIVLQPVQSFAHPTKISSICWNQLSVYLNAQIKGVSCLPPKDQSIPVECQYYKVSELDAPQSALLEQWKSKTKQTILLDQKLSQLFGLSVSLCARKTSVTDSVSSSAQSTFTIHPRLEQHPQKLQIMKLVIAIHEPPFVPQSPSEVYATECDGGSMEACTLQSLLQYRNGTSQEREKIVKILNWQCDRGSSLACIKNGYYSLEMGLVQNAQVMYKKACEQRGGNWCTINKEVQKLKDIED